jgi:cold shock CspA family protein/ribosome-associated translation inhibitor RaiA
MRLPVDITFHNLGFTEWMDAEIRKRAAKLEVYCPDIVSCRVLVEIPHRHHQQGNRLRLSIVMTVPGEEIAVSQTPSLHGLQRDLHEPIPEKRFEIEAMRKDGQLVIRQAFDIARRRLQDYAHRRRRAVKTHESPPHGRVVRWLPEKHFGVIDATDGSEIYFHEHSVLGGGLRRLMVGADVTFVEERGEKGLQASTVKVIGKHPERFAV